VTSRQRNLLYGSLGLLLTATVLLTSHRWISPPRHLEDNGRPATLVWQAFPTRTQIDPVSPSATEYYDTIQRAILNQDFRTADVTITQAKDIYPDDARINQSEARLAFVQENYDEAEKLIWVAIGLDPSNGKNWALAGTILTHNDKPAMAAQALAIALQLTPDLAPHMFQERWRIAILNGDNQTLTNLADDYYLINPADVLADYYNARALLAAGHNNIALNILVDRLTAEPQSPAALWYLLGQTYLERKSYWESATALENAQLLIDSGDTSMLVVVGEPHYVLEDNLAKAYFGSQRCVQAESLFRTLAAEAENDDYTSWIKQAVACQTPTPTPTHWMLSLQATATPSPN